MPAPSLPPDPRYADLFAGARATLPGAANPVLAAFRESSFERFRRLGFPGPKAEAWKYTSVGRLAARPFALASPKRVPPGTIAPHLLDRGAAIRLVFVNGHFAAELSDEVSARRGVTLQPLARALADGRDELAELLPERDPERAFSALNGALATDGCLVRLADGTRLDHPVQLLFVSLDDGGPTLGSPRNLVVLGDDARLHLVETHLDLGTRDGLTNLVNRLVLGRRAELLHDRLQIGGAAGSLIGTTEYELSADSRLTQGVLTIGGALVRNEIEAMVLGSGVELALNGLYLARAREHVDTLIRVDHAQPGSHSDQFYKGILDERAHAVFAGQIIVRRAAQQTNAYQSNANLLLSPEAEIDTKPELEIFADDVKCSHGATAGDLDERELFYLRSRGLDPTTAASLLTFAFADEVLERFGAPRVAALAKRHLLRWLPGGAALGELL